MTILGLYFFVTGMVIVGLASRLVFKLWELRHDHKRSEFIKDMRKEDHMKQFLQYFILYHLLWFYVWAVNLLTRTVDEF